MEKRTRWPLEVVVCLFGSTFLAGLLPKGYSMLHKNNIVGCIGVLASILAVIAISVFAYQRILRKENVEVLYGRTLGSLLACCSPFVLLATVVGLASSILGKRGSGSLLQQLRGITIASSILVWLLIPVALHVFFQRTIHKTSYGEAFSGFWSKAPFLYGLTLGGGLLGWATQHLYEFMGDGPGGAVVQILVNSFIGAGILHALLLLYSGNTRQNGIFGRKMVASILLLCLIGQCIPLVALAEELHLNDPLYEAPLEQPEEIRYEAFAEESGTTSSEEEVVLEEEIEPDKPTETEETVTKEEVPQEKEEQPTEIEPTENAVSPERIEEESLESADRTETEENRLEEVENSPVREPRSPIHYPSIQEQLAAYGEPIALTEQSITFKKKAASPSSIHREENRQDFVTVISSVPLQYEDEEGILHEIDNTLEEVQGSYLNKENPLRMEFSAGTRLDSGVNYIELLPQFGDFSNPIHAGNAVRYNDVLPGLDVQYTAQEVQMKEDLILYERTEEPVTEFQYRLRTNLQVTEDHGLLLFHDANGTLVFLLTAPQMTDAAGVESTNLKLRLDGDVVILSVDREWIQSEEREYPIVIDPVVKEVERAQYSSLTVGQSFYEPGVGHLFAGVIPKGWVYPGDENINLTRGFLYFHDIATKVPAEGEIDKATLFLTESNDFAGSTFQLYRAKEKRDLAYFQQYGTTGQHWQKALDVQKEFVASFKGKNGQHQLDVTEVVNNWVKGVYPNYGFVLTVELEDSYSKGGRFTRADNSDAPFIQIEWHTVGAVPSSYSLDETTVQVRPVNYSDRDNGTRFLGAFWDGMGTPLSELQYELNIANRNYKGTVEPDVDYLYPNSAPYNTDLLATRYRRRLSNWQTTKLFTNWEENVEYKLRAQASKSGKTGKKVESDSFLVYRAKGYDTLSKIANYYGIEQDVLYQDNRVYDGLVREGDTYFIRNPKRTEPYTSTLTNEDEYRIDKYLMGRGANCVFGYEPINLNTGNFFYEAEDGKVTNAYGEYPIVRSYNSKGSGTLGLFGRGWSFSYDESLTMGEEGSLLLKRGDGGLTTFEDQGDGLYLAPLETGQAIQRTKVGEQTIDFGTDEDSDKQTFPVYEYVLTERDGRKKVFNSLGLLIKVVDVFERETLLSYIDGSLAKVELPGGKAFLLDVNEDGLISKITLPDGSSLHYGYDAKLNLVSFTNQEGEKTGYTYNEKHEMLTWVDANGTVMIQNTYDAEGRVTKQVDGNGNAAVLSYTDGCTTATDSNGRITKYVYDDYFRILEVQHWDGTTEKTTYNEQGLVSSEADRLGNVLRYEYDDRGNCTAVKRGDGGVLRYTYNENNDMLTSTDWEGNETRYTYSGRDLVEIVHPDGTSTQLEYMDHLLMKVKDGNGNDTVFAYGEHQLSSVTDAEGYVTSFGYDKMGRMIQVTDANGDITRTAYDRTSRVVKEIAGDGGVTQIHYDPAGLVTGITDARGYTTSFQYDGMDNLSLLTDAEGNGYRFTYDSMNHKLTEEDPLGNKISWTYDLDGRIQTVTDANGNVAKYVWDAAGNPLSYTDGEGNKTTYEWDTVLGQVSSITDPMGNTTRITYNKNGQTTGVVYPDGIEETYTYNSRGNLVKAVDQAGLETRFFYDAVGNLIRTEDTAGRVEKYEVDKRGAVVSYVSPLGHKSRYEVDGVGQVTAFTDARNATAGVVYTAVGLPAQVTDALGGKTRFSYDLAGNLTEQVDALGGSRKYSYDYLGNLVLFQDAEGHQTKQVYNSAGRLVEVHDALGHVTKYAYDGNGNLVCITDALGNETRYAYDANGNPTKVVFANGTFFSYEYNGNGQLTKTVNPDGLVLEQAYDAMGRVIRAWDNCGTEDRYEYDSTGNLTKHTDSLGRETVYEYDIVGNLLSVTEPGGAKTSFTYDLEGNIGSSTDAEGKTTTYTYDAAGNLIQAEDASLRVWRYTYDLMGQLTATENPLQGILKAEYDLLGRVITLTDELGHKETFGYDKVGQLVSYTDKNGNETKQAFDAVGNLIWVQLPNGAETQYGYDAVGQRTKERDALGHVTEYGYDHVGNLTDVVLPNGGALAYGYTPSGLQIETVDALGAKTLYERDLLGRLIKRTDANGAVYTNTYDALGRIIEQTGPEGEKSSYDYDLAGNVISETDAQGRITAYEWDVLHRITKVVDANGGGTTVSYDKQGNMQRVVSPEGRTYRYSYDELDQLVEIENPLGHKTLLSYDAVGNPTGIMEPNNRKTSYTYDPNGNLIGAEDALGQKEHYVYDAVNNLMKVTDRAGSTTTLVYDLLSQVTEVRDGLGHAAQYAYNELGDMLSFTDEEGRKTQYGYDLMGQLTSVTDGLGIQTTYGYDLVGNLVSRRDGNGKETSYTYDLANMVKQVKNVDSSIQQYNYDAVGNLTSMTLPSGKMITYNYDGLNAIIGKSAAGEAGATYSYDKDGLLVSHTDGSGTTSFEYDLAGNLLFHENGAGYLLRYRYNENGERTGVEYPDKKGVSYELDSLGRISKVTERSGKTTVYQYNEWDQVVEQSSSDGSKVQMMYDALGRLVAKNNTGPDGKELSSFRYAYDDSGNIVSEVSVVDGKKTEKKYVYNARGELVASSVNGKKTTYDYDASGNRIKMTDSDGVRTYTLDAAGRVMLAEGPEGTESFMWDEDGNLMRWKDTEGSVYTFQYNTAGQLTKAYKNGELVEAILYDALGDRVFQQRLTYVQKTDTTVTPGLWRWFYRDTDPEEKQEPVKDAVAPSKEKQEEVAEVKEDNEPVSQSVTREEEAIVTDLHLFRYGFATVMLRVLSGPNQLLGTEAVLQLQEWWLENHGVEEKQIPVETSPPVENYSPETKQDLEKQGYSAQDISNLENIGVTEEELEQVFYKEKDTVRQDTYEVSTYDRIYYVNDILAEYTEVLMEDSAIWGATSYSYGDTRLSSDGAKGDLTYFYDGRGSVLQALGKGNNLQNYSYTDYGKVDGTVYNGKKWSIYGYNGEEQDPLTNLQYLRARYYLPHAGTFTARDRYAGILQQPRSQNAYTYAVNDPINYIDPSGYRVQMMAMSDGGSSWKASYAKRSKVASQVLQQKAKVAEAYNNAVSTKKSYSFNPLPTAPVNRSGYPPSYTTQEPKQTVLNPYLERQRYIALQKNRKQCPDIDVGGGLARLGATVAVVGVTALTVTAMVGSMGAATIPAALVISQILGTTFTNAGVIYNIGMGILTASEVMIAASYVIEIQTGTNPMQETLFGGDEGAFDDYLMLTNMLSAGYLEWVAKLGIKKDGQEEYNKDSQTINDYEDRIISNRYIPNQSNNAWRVGDRIDALTPKGTPPSWTTVRRRIWKNEAFYNSEAYTATQLERIEEGLAPYYGRTNISMEIHHITQRYEGGTDTPENLMLLWPWEHAEVDPHRFYTGEMPF